MLQTLIAKAFQSGELSFVYDNAVIEEGVFLVPTGYYNPTPTVIMTIGDRRYTVIPCEDEFGALLDKINRLRETGCVFTADAVILSDERCGIIFLLDEVVIARMIVRLNKATSNAWVVSIVVGQVGNIERRSRCL